MTVLTSVAAVPVAQACTCMPRGCGVVGAGGVIFEGTVASIESGAGGERIVHLTDVRSLRGDAVPAFVLGGNGVDCGYQFRCGVPYLIEAEPGAPMAA